jgi:two-component sensor histidine kinase
VPAFRDLSIRRKLVLIIVLTSGIALFLACGALVAYDWLSTRQGLVRQVETLAAVVGTNSTAALTFDNPRDATETLAALGAEPRVVTACTYLVSGQPFARYLRPGAEAEIPALQPDGHRFGTDRLDLFHPILLEGQRIGTVYIRTDLQELSQRLRRYLGVVAALLVGSGLVAFLLAARLREIISGPVLHLVDAMRQVSEREDYTVRVSKRGQDELGRLTDGFNDMLSQIQDRELALQRAHAELEDRARDLQRELFERLRAEERIRASLQEKEVLLQEIHHRVKNNLQIISSLLDLQTQHLGDREVVAMFRDSRDRIKSMALIHERLYQSEDLAHIDFGSYIETLSTNLFRSYGEQVDGVALEARAEGITLDIDTAIPCGLIINELVSNALKHAFPDGRTGTVSVALDRAEEGADTYLLRVRDNGVGLPAGVDVRTTSSLGLRLVNVLVRQLRGTIELDATAGTEFRISFRAAK